MKSRLLLLIAAFIGGCESGGGAVAASTPERDSTSAAPESAPTSRTAVAQRTEPSSCDLIPSAEIERVAGPLAGEPEPEDRGCWFYVAVDTSTAEWRQIRAGAERARAAGMDERAIALYHPTRAGIYAEVDVRGEGSASDEKPANLPAGWDEARISPSGAVFNGRTGHVRVSVRVQGLELDPDTVVAIASRIRDRVPEGPMPHPAAGPSGYPGPGPDPCTVLTRSEAETVLGPLVANPFRTRERTPLADPSGKSCAWLSDRHRVLVLTPVWNYGGIELSAARMVGGMVRQVAELAAIEGDTLEGAWDEAVVDLTGEILLRRGGRVLGIRYLMSSTQAPGALRLGTLALDRMASYRGDSQ